MIITKSMIMFTSGEGGRWLGRDPSRLLECQYWSTACSGWLFMDVQFIDIHWNVHFSGKKKKEKEVTTKTKCSESWEWCNFLGLLHTGSEWPQFPCLDHVVSVDYFQNLPWVTVLDLVLDVTEAPSALSVEVIFWGLVYSVSPNTSHGIGTLTSWGMERICPFCPQMSEFISPWTSFIHGFVLFN